MADEKIDLFYLCFNCKRAYNSKIGAKHCGKCGGPLIEECPKCGTVFHSEDFDYCVLCGEKLNQ